VNVQLIYVILKNNVNINFKVFDATIEKLPYADLILIKDIFTFKF
jgi:hypothetical protein